MEAMELQKGDGLHVLNETNGLCRLHGVHGTVGLLGIHWVHLLRRRRPRAYLGVGLGDHWNRVAHGS